MDRGLNRRASFFLPKFHTCSLSPDQLNRLKVKYELQGLEKILFSDLDPKHVAKQVNKAAWLKKCGREISLEVERSIAVIREEVLNCDSEIRITRYIQQHQYGVIKMMDNSESYLGQSKLKGNGLATEYEKGLASLGQILTFIQSNYLVYVDKNFKIADSTRHSFSSEIRLLIKQTESRFQEYVVDEELAAFILQPFYYFLEPTNEINQSDLDYVLIFKKEIHRFLGSRPITDNSMLTLLINLNFNDPAFVFYYVGKMKERVLEQNPHAQLDYYSMQLKNLNQFPKRQGQAFDSNIPSVHDQLRTWLVEEINFLEKNIQLLPAISETRTDPEPDVEKLTTALSVAGLSFGIKLLLDAGIIIKSNTSEVMRLVSKSFRTENVDDISEDSLRNKVYNVEPRAVEGVKGMVIKLLNEVRKY